MAFFGEMDRLASAKKRLRELDAALKRAEEDERRASMTIKDLLLRQQLEIQKGPPPEAVDGLSGGLGFWPALIAIGTQVAGAIQAKQAAKKQQKMIKKQRQQAEAEARAAELEAQKQAQLASPQKSMVMGIPSNVLLVGGVVLAGALVLALILKRR